MKIDTITLSAIVYSTESREKVSMALSNLIPFEFEIMVSKARGHYGNPLEFLEVEIKKKREIKEFWNHFIESLGSEREILAEMLDEILDEEGVMRIRVEKQSAYLGKVRLAFGGDAIVIKVKIVTYPAKREKMMEFGRKLVVEGYD